MRIARRTWIIGVLCCVALFVAVFVDWLRSRSAQSDLRAIGVAYTMHHDSVGYCPGDVRDLANFVEVPNNSLIEKLLQKCFPRKRDSYRFLNRYIICFELVDGKPLTFGAMQNLGKSIIAYEPNAPRQGGWVLLVDGSVVLMSAEQVQALRPENMK